MRVSPKGQHYEICVPLRANNQCVYIECKDARWASYLQRMPFKSVHTCVRKKTQFASSTTRCLSRVPVSELAVTYIQSGVSYREGLHYTYDERWGQIRYIHKQRCRASTEAILIVAAFLNFPTAAIRWGHLIQLPFRSYRCRYELRHYLMSRSI